jgi:hypothetical protein
MIANVLHEMSRRKEMFVPKSLKRRPEPSSALRSRTGPQTFQTFDFVKNLHGILLRTLVCE